ncbi:hypothetical protein F3Y22_tig00001478pilonHSYRG00394 [Hibiscus syriacus]|uniref:Serine-threonine/tyrosine-protein kinase catalytic domain-containing protein n=1 Tax=Hibiscus syriacus TaxID=106335 RepID=A0A6A3CV85_HIBSY|nr:hypothetical protein F3Y22_tig00001478pilonHSYRG00394 [Hibiscus syriacus]
MSPEYAMHGQFSVKLDAYSFGVLVFEIISGQRNSNFYQTDGAEDLISYAWKLWKDENPLELLNLFLGTITREMKSLDVFNSGYCVFKKTRLIGRRWQPSFSCLTVTLSHYQCLKNRHSCFTVEQMGGCHTKGLNLPLHQFHCPSMKYLLLNWTLVMPVKGCIIVFNLKVGK